MQPTRSGEIPVAEPVHRWPNEVMVIVRVPAAGKEPQDHVLVVKTVGFSGSVHSAVFFVSFGNPEKLNALYIGDFIAAQLEDSSGLYPI